MIPLLKESHMGNTENHDKLCSRDKEEWAKPEVIFN